jgi:hypothetical protein
VITNHHFWFDLTFFTLKFPPLRCRPTLYIDSNDGYGGLLFDGNFVGKIIVRVWVRR